jgi:cytochrome c oxidase cbb3-type subunit 4
MTIDINTLRVAVTVVSFAVFVGILLWAGSGRNRKGFEEAARIPIDDEEALRPPSPQPSPTPRSTPWAPEGEGAKVGQVFAKRERR